MTSINFVSFMKIKTWKKENIYIKFRIITRVYKSLHNSEANSIHKTLCNISGLKTLMNPRNNEGVAFVPCYKQRIILKRSRKQTINEQEFIFRLKSHSHCSSPCMIIVCIEHSRNKNSSRIPAWMQIVRTIWIIHRIDSMKHKERMKILTLNRKIDQIRNQNLNLIQMLRLHRSKFLICHGFRD